MGEGKWAVPCPKCGKRIEWRGEFSQRPKCVCERPATPGVNIKPKSTVKVSATPQADDSAEQAFELCDEIESLADDVPSRGQDFADSVLEKAADIRASVEQLGRASDGQISALENMRDGLSRWIR